MNASSLRESQLIYVVSVQIYNKLIRLQLFSDSSADLPAEICQRLLETRARRRNPRGLSCRSEGYTTSGYYPWQDAITTIQLPAQSRSSKRRDDVVVRDSRSSFLARSRACGYVQFAMHRNYTSLFLSSPILQHASA